MASAGVPIRSPLETAGGRGWNWDRVAVDGDPDAVQAVLGLLAVERRLAQVAQHEVNIGPARQDTHATAGAEQLCRDRLRAATVRSCLFPEGLRSCDPQGHRLAGDDVLQGAALLAGEHGGVDRLGELLGAQDSPPRPPPIVLWIVVVTTSRVGTGLGADRPRPGPRSERSTTR